MKKGFFIILLTISCFLLVGCTIGESKKEVLSCNKNDVSSKIPYNITHDLTFTGQKITIYKMTFKFDLSSIYSDKDLFEKTVENLTVEYSKAVENGVTIDVYPDGSNVIVIIEMNSQTFDGVLNYINYDFTKVFKSNVSLEEIKPEMEKELYSCSIK